MNLGNLFKNQLKKISDIFTLVPQVHVSKTMVSKFIHVRMACNLSHINQLLGQEIKNELYFLRSASIENELMGMEDEGKVVTHKQLYDDFVKEFKHRTEKYSIFEQPVNKCMDLKCVGGGEIEWYNEIRRVAVIGTSQEFGMPDHQAVVDMMRNEFGTYFTFQREMTVDELRKLDDNPHGIRHFCEGHPEYKPFEPYYDETGIQGNEQITKTIQPGRFDTKVVD